MRKSVAKNENPAMRTQLKMPGRKVEMSIVTGSGRTTYTNVAMPVPLEGVGVAIVYNNIAEKQDKV
jgi:hypothetical protein